MDIKADLHVSLKRLPNGGWKIIASQTLIWKGRNSCTSLKDDGHVDSTARADGQAGFASGPKRCYDSSNYGRSPLITLRTGVRKPSPTSSSASSWVRMQVFITLITLLYCAHSVFAWGADTHPTIGHIAESFLLDQTVCCPLWEDHWHRQKTALTAILASEPQYQGSIGEAANWPDQIRRQRPATEGWHFIDAEDKYFSASPDLFPCLQEMYTNLQSPR